MAAAASKDGGGKFSFDTGSVLERDRLSYWSEFVSQRIMGVSMQTSMAHAFSGKIQVHTCNDVGFSFSKADACSAVSASGATPSRAGWWIVRHNRDGRIVQGGCDSVFKSRDVLLIDSTRSYRRDESVVDATSIFLPLAEIGGSYMQHQLEDLAACRLQARKAGWSRLLSSLLSGLTPELAQVLCADQIERRLFLDQVRNVLFLALREVKGLDLRSPGDWANVSKLARHQLFLRMQKWLRDNFRRPNLTAQCLATEFGVSVRYVHQLYADHVDQGSFLCTLRTLRLAEAMRMLGSPECCSWSIAQIGYHCGFNDPAYFGLIFRRGFGCTPKSARATLMLRNRESRRLPIEPGLNNG